MLEEIGPIVAAITIPTLWAAVTYRCWILPALKKGA